MELRAKHEASVKAAEDKLAEELAQKQELLRREFEEGVDLSAERAKSTAAIDKAEKAVQEAKELRDAAFAYTVEKSKEGRVKALDLALDWNENFINGVREKELAPIVGRLASARSDMYNALLDFYELVDKYDPLRREIAELEDRESNAERRTTRYITEIEQDYNLPLVKEMDIRNIKNRRELPDGIKRK
ncbi:hypothetical protein GCM10010913_33060 [Paenibacillus aceti]|uniref:Uncharacterized protein n=2 Tax=Paenibacillus aceti TaxID=1820010 RepID=A0ABQ1W1B0_9BACL|nr:hypothetical protein [Paenibacillus aceti]GGG08690.1 hypothetical protein GCM10010913_33060 [Paenibacillus aceti]